MKITKSQLRKIIKEEMKGSMNELRIDAPPDPWQGKGKRGKGRKKAPTDAELDAVWQRQQSPTYKGRGTLKSPESEVGGMDLAPESLPLPKKRPAHLDNERKKDYLRRTALLPGKLDEESEDEVDMKEEIRLIAAEALYAIEDAELIERIRDILPKQMRNVVDGKLKEFKISVDEFIQEKITSLTEEGTVSDHTKPWLQIKPFEETKNLEEEWKDDYETPESKKGYCTPMSKSTCTPRRKAFARRAKAGWPKGEGSTPGYKK